METYGQLKTQPFLTRYAVTRIPQPQIGGGYCPDRDVWVEKTPEGSRPIVTANSVLAGMITKTLTVQEQDDDHFICVPELVTKTEQQQESDDQSMGLSLNELVTKTYLELESDDQGAQLL
jgi:hypothetical protein